MTDPFSIAMINLAAGLLVFFAAIIPISYKIWRKAKEANSTYRLKITLLGLCSIVSYTIGLIWGWKSGADFTVVLLFGGGFAFYALFFYVQDAPIDRQSVVLLVVQSMLVTLTVLLYFASTLTDLVGKIVNG